MKIKLNEREIHAIYMSIIEHWSMPQYEQELSKVEFDQLNIIRAAFSQVHKIIDKVDESKLHDIEIAEGSISAMIKAMKIGMRELDPIEFPIIVGEPWEYGTELISRIEMLNQNT